jgi:NADH-quinone oxidoreductase subunit F
MNVDMEQLRILTKSIALPESWTLQTYRAQGGYDAAVKALTELQPDELIDVVKTSGLRGRGGAGFPTGMKWSFVPKNIPKPTYLVCNADESEPGTFKDRLMIERVPHQILEGMIIASYALRVRTAFVYVRGEMTLGARRLQEAIDEAYAAGCLGKNLLGTGMDLDILLFVGAGAYICGEETALLESLEGKRGQPRLKPPFPATVGLYGCPTVVNNVETLCNLPHIVAHGPEWYTSMGTEKSPGPRLFSVSGHVKRRGVYELPMGVPLRELIFEHAGGIRDGHRFKAVIPGGSSVPVLDESKLDVGMDFESLQQAGSLLGSAGVIVMDDTTCMVSAALNLLHFYWHESCGKCTPCREGTGWFVKTLHRIEAGHGRPEDLDLLLDVVDNIRGKTFCPFGDAAVTPVDSMIRLFRDDFEQHIVKRRCVAAA